VRAQLDHGDQFGPRWPPRTLFASTQGFATTPKYRSATGQRRHPFGRGDFTPACFSYGANPNTLWFSFPRAVSVTRVDGSTLRVRPEHGYFASDVHQLLRDPNRTFHKGAQVELSNMTATVTESTADGRPVTVEFAFAAPLESPVWLWMRGEGWGLVAWTPPAVGETVVVPAAL